jgi:hypothetical protein
MQNFLRDWLRGSPKASVSVKGSVHVEHRNAAGELIFEETVRNTVITASMEWLKARACSTNAKVATYIGLSDDVAAPAAGATDLEAVVYTAFGLQRALGAYASGANGVCTIMKVFTNDTAQHVVGSTGLYYEAADPGLFAGVALSTSATLEVSDTLTITWTVTFAAA